MLGDFGPSRRTVCLVHGSNGCSPPTPTRLSGAARSIGVDLSSVAITLGETSYGFDVFLGSYASFVFHMAKVIAAIFLASVSLARLGLVPAASNRS